ncbi:MAG: DnaJ domain-containing protein [bacterium]
MEEYDFQKGIAEEIKSEKLARRILGVAKNAGPEKIKKAFWLLAMKYHPDKTPGDKESERRFQNIVNAYDYLFKGKRKRVVLVDGEVERPLRNSGYCIDNPWGYYLWWRDKFFDDKYGIRPNIKGPTDEASVFDRAKPADYEAWYRTPKGKRLDAEEKSTLARLLGRGNGARLLDLGCGTGHFADWFAGQGYRVFGIDISRRFIRYAGSHSDASFTIADGADIPFADNAFHTAVGITALEFVRFPERAILEMFRVAAKRLLFLMLNPASDLNAQRKRRGAGVFGYAKFWEPEKAGRFIKDIVPDKKRHSIYQEFHVDFYVLLLEKKHGAVK